MKHPTLYTDKEIAEAIKSEYKVYLRDRDRVITLTHALEHRRNEPISAYGYTSSLETARNLPYGYVSAIDLIEDREEEIFALSRDLDLARKRVIAREAAFADLRKYYELTEEKGKRVCIALYANLVLGRPLKKIKMAPATLVKYKHTLIYFCAQRYEEEHLWRSNTPKKNPHVLRGDTKEADPSTN